MRKRLAILGIAFAGAACGSAPEPEEPTADPRYQAAAPTPGAIEKAPTSPEGKAAPDVRPLWPMPPRADIVSRAVAPLWGQATQADVLGVKLGMSPEAVAARLRESGFRLDDSRVVEFDGYSGEYLQQALFTKGGILEDRTETVRAYFTPSAHPQLYALFRKTGYDPDVEVPYDRMLATIRGKYGEPAAREKNRMGDVEWLVWPSAGASSCEQTRSGLWNLDRGQPWFDNAGCARGLMMSLHFDDDEEAHPVGLVKTYLVDSAAGRVGRETIRSFVAEKEERERREALEAARPAEL